GHRRHRQRRAGPQRALERLDPGREHDHRRRLAGRIPKGDFMRASFCIFSVLLLASAPVLAQDAKIAPRAPDVIYVPTPPEVVEEMLKLADVKKGDVLYDLGS